MPQQASCIKLSGRQQEALVQITRRHRSEQQQVLRARIVLTVAQGYSNAQIACDLVINVDTVRLWRDRWASLQGMDEDTLSVAERLRDVSRPGTPPRITAEQRCRIAALACEAPMRSDRPICQWTGREIAAEVKARGFVGQISPRHAAYLLKGGCNCIGSATGSQP